MMDTDQQNLIKFLTLTEKTLEVHEKQLENLTNRMNAQCNRCADTRERYQGLFSDMKIEFDKKLSRQTLSLAVVSIFALGKFGFDIWRFVT